MFLPKQIPKQIWTFWDSDDPPDFVKKCINTWKIHNSSYKITLLTNKNLIKYLDQTEINFIRNWKYNNSSQMFSDLIRLSILEKYGGIWMDASIICNESLDWIYKENAKCIMYSIPEYNTIESWFIACTSNNRFIKKLNKELRSVYDINEYINKIDTTGIPSPEYLLIYVCARKVYKPGDVKLLNASIGPYRYHVNGGLGSFKTHESSHHRIIKFRKDERRDMNQEIEQYIFKEVKPSQNNGSA